MQVAEMADAEAGDLEDEDRVAVLDHLAAGIVAEIAADVGGDIADEDVADALGDLRRLPVVAPAVQHMGNARVRKQRVMGAVRAVHGDDVGQPAGGIGAAEIGRDPHPPGRVDVVGRMPGIGDRDLVGLRIRRAETDRHGARRGIGHRQAFAARGVLRRGGGGDQRAEQGQNGTKTSQHNQARHEDGMTVSRNPAFVIAAFFVSRQAGQALNSKATIREFAARVLH